MSLIKNRKVWIALMLCLATVLWVSLAMPAEAATVTSGNGTWISGKLTYTYSVTSDGTSANGATGSVSASSGTLTVKAVSSKFVDGGCNADTNAFSTTTTVTVTNASSYPLKITTLTSSSATVTGVSQGQTIASGATFTITVTANPNSTSDTSSRTTTGTVTISVEEQTSVTITLASSPYVSYTVNGKTVAQNGTDQTFTTNAGTSISLPTITAPNGYEFKGWRIGGNLITSSSFTADAGYTVFPVIVTSGTNITAANFKVGSNTYTFWDDAVAAAVSGGGTIFVNATSVTLPANVLDNLLPAAGGTYVKPVSGDGVEYILPAGVTLVVPYNTSTTVHTTTPAYSTADHVAPSAFRTLTVPSGAKITVNGSVSVDSLVSAVGQNASSWNGTPSGPHGKIVMKSGSEMTFNSGANLYCYGYINGDGNIYIKSGANVYELFQLRCWRGGSATSGMPDNSYKVFPMNQYYVQNVEAAMTLYYGAKEYVWTVANMNSSAYAVQSPAEFIGSGGMFRISNGGSVTKKYHANTDHLEIEVNGNMSIGKMYLMIPISVLIMNYDVEIKTENYVLPITNNMDITIHSGTTSIDSSQKNGIAFLPGSVLTVDEGATFNMNAPVYVYDVSEWGKYGAGDCDIVPVGYSTANGTTTIRTINNIGDAVLDINGTLTVGNKLYTTASGANITSSTGTGEVKFTSAPATDTTTTYQATQSGTDITYVPITCNNAWLQNGDESHSQTVSTGVSNWYYDKPGEHWYRYTVDFLLNDNPDAIARDYYCENNDSITYDASWLANLGASVTSGTATAAISGTDVNVTGVSTNAVVTLTGTPAEYIPTFVLNEKQYSIYQLYTGNTLSDTTTIGGNTYYIVNQAESALAVGTTYAAPTDASMGITAANHNTITWNMSGISVTSGNPYLGTVPRGETAGGPSYVYGFYTGVVAHNSWNDQYYDTLIGAFEVLPQDAKNVTITLLADCGTFEEENSTVAYATYPDNNITLNLNGHKAVGRIVNQGTFTLELNGGTLDFHTGATAAAAGYKGMAAIINSGTMTVQDSAGGGKITTDAISTESGANGSAVIRNNAGGTLTITGHSSEDLLTIYEYQTEVEYNKSYGYYAYNYGIYNLGRITALTNVDITTTQSRTTGVNVYNYNTGVIDLISGGHMFAYSGTSLFNYGGTINTVDGLTIDGKNGITNRNIRGGSLAAGYTVAEADKGVIDTITNCHIEVGQYAINNNAVINTISSCTLIAAPDTAQCDTRGDGLATASEGNVAAYTVFNSANWWYDTNVWKRVDSSSNGYTRVDTYREEEQYRPTIGTITNCEIYAENTTTSASYGDYALVNSGGVIGKIGGTTNIKTYKHPDSTATITTSHYAMHNLNGGIIKSIEGTVNISATGIGTVYNDGVFTTQINYTYGNKVGGNVTRQVSTYGEPSTINSITCSGTWSCGSYYALMNSGYIGTINAPNLTLQGNTSSYNVLYNATGGVNSTYDYTCEYTDVATAATAYHRHAVYTKNLEKGSTIGTLNGVTVIGKYNVLNNQGHIGTLSNVNVSNNAASNDPTFLNGDSRYATVIEDRKNVASYAEDYPHVTISAGYATRYDREYTYSTPPTIDVIDNLTVNSTGQYALRNAGHIGTLKNSTLTASTNYALHNSATGPYTERTTVQYYSGASVFATTKYTSEYASHYKRNPATIGTIDNCTIQTNTSTHAALNVGHIGTIKDSTFTAGATKAAQYALANLNSQEREYTRDCLDDVFYCTANGGTACTAYFSTGGETNTVVYDYDAPSIDLIGEGNTFKATTTVIANTGIITAIDSGEGALTTITGSAAKGSTIYNYSACLDARTTTTPYTAAASAPANGTAGTAVNDDTLLPGAQIGTIKNVYINANGYGILNGDATTGKTPTIDEIGVGTEIYAHCTTAGYHAIYNQANAKVSSITGGIFTTTKATTNAYKNNNTAEGYATVITGGDFKGMAVGRANAIFEPDNTARQTYGTAEAPKVLSANSRTVDFNNGTAVAEGTGYYYISDPVAKVDHVILPESDTEGDPETVTSYYPSLAAAVAAAKNGDTVTMLADEELPDLVAIEGKNIILDLNGFTVSKGTASAIQVKGTGTLTVKDSSDSQTGVVRATAATAGSSDAIVVLAGGSFTLESGTIRSNTYGISTLGTATVTGGTVIGDAGVLYKASDSATFTVSGGWFNHEVSSEFCAPGYYPITDAEHTPQYTQYTVSNLYTVTFNANGHGTAPTAQSVEYGQKATAPTAPTADDYTFDGWFKEAACTNAWNFDTDTVTADTELFAKWTAEATSITGATVTVSGTYTYTGSAITPDAANVTVRLGETTLIYGTDYTFEVTNNTSAGQATVTVTGKGNYKDTATGTFTIGNASQAAPTGLTGVKETYKGQGNGSITGVTTAMEYRKGTTDSFTKVTAAMLTDGALTGLASGSYEVRLAAKTNYDASPATTVTVGEGDMITITWNVEGTTTFSEVTYGETPAFSGETPTKAGDAQYSYTFSGWNPAIGAVTAPTTYIAQFSSTVNTYTVTWTMAGDGPSEAEFKAAVDAMITAKAGTLAADPDTGVTVYEPYILPYMLEEWGITGSDNNYVTNMVLAVGLNDDSYLATANTYWDSCKSTIVDTLIDAKRGSTDLLSVSEKSELESATSGGGTTVLETDENVPYGTTPTFDGETPTKAGDAQYSYNFSGWSTDGETVIDPLTGITGDTTYIAVFTQTVNTYTITWKDGNGDTLKTEQVAYSSTPSYTGSTPTKTATAQYTYTFNNTWSPAIASVTGAATYTAQFDSTVNAYTVQWVIQTGNSEAEIKAALEIMIEGFAQEVWDAAYADLTSDGMDMSFMWTMSQDSQMSFIRAKLQGDYNLKTALSTYVAERIQVIQNSTFSSTAATLAEEVWDGLDKSALGTTMSGTTDLITDEQKASFAAMGGSTTVLETDENVPYGTTPSYDGETPTKAGDAQYSYTFSGWEPEVSSVTGDVTYVAQFTQSVNEYTITWVDGNGDTLKTDTVAYGTTPSYTGATPTKTATDQYTYTFNNTWSPAITAVTGATTYTAQFDSTVNEYTITWVDGNGDTLKTEQVAYGETPSYTGATPTKTATDQYTYTFNNTWNPEIAPVTEAATYTAQFNSTLNEYTITFLDEDGETVLQSSSVAYGETPVYTGETPTKTATAQYSYTFGGWDQEITAVTGEATYTATYTSTVNQYTVTFVDEDGTELSSESYAYGTLPSAIEKPNDPTKASTEQFEYTFAGWTPSVAIVTRDATYTATYSSKKLISYSEITVSIPDQTYTGDTLTPVVTVTNGDALTEGTDYTVTLPEGCVSAGEYTVTITGIGDYTGSRTATFTITPKAATVSADAKTKVYGTSDPTLTAAVTGVIDDDTLNYSLARAEGSNVGEYTITVTLGENPNYNVTATNGTFTITQKALTITADSDSKVYDGTALTKDSYTYTALVEGDTIESVTVTGTQTNVGTSNNVPSAAVIKNGSTDVTANYNITYTNGTLSITKRSVTLTSATDSKEYDGAALTNSDVTVTGDGFADGEGASYNVTGSQKLVGESANAFTYTLNEGTLAANYEITKVEGTLTVTERTAKYEITVTANSGTATYDGDEHSIEGFETLEYTFDSVTYTVSGLSASVTGTDAGTYTAEVTGTAVVKDSENNDLTGQFIVNKVDGTLTINKRSVTLTSATDTKTYDGRALTNDTVTVSGDGFATGEGASYTVTGSQKVVGSSANTFSYELSSGTKAANYNITTSEGTLTVASREAKYEISPQANSGEFKYDGQTHTVSGFVTNTFTVDGNEYTVSGLTATATGTNAGEYTVSVTGTAKVEDSDGNDVTSEFSVTPLTGTLTITKREVTMTSASGTKEYDGTALTNSEVTVTGDGFVEGEGATYSVTGTRTLVGSNDNTFTYTLNEGTSADNYTITTSFGTLTITSRSAQYEVTLTANSGEYKYDGSEKTVTGWTIDNGAGGSFTAENGLTYTVEGMTAEATGINAGSYTVNVTGTPVVKDSDGNNVTEQFAVNTVSGTLSITKRAVTLTSATDSKAYDGSALTNSNVTVTGDGFATGEGATYNVTGSQTLPGYSANAFTYTLNEGTLADNYNISTENGTLTINDRTDKYEITVEANSGEYTYDGTEKAVSGFKTLEYTIDGVTYTVSGLTAEVSGTNVGTYTATVTGTPVVKDAGGNDLTAQFHVTTRNGTLTIDPAAATVTADAKSKVYGDSDPDLTATITGVVEGESLNYTLARAEGENVGEYAITVTLGENPNYDVTPMNGTFTITKKAATVTADAKSKTYGDSDPDLTATVTGLVGSDKLNYTLARAEGEDVGSYDITVTLGSNPNYEVTATNGTFTITRATATVTADAKTKVYGAADPTLTAAVTGLQNGDAENVITYTLTRAEGEDVGEYTITPAGDTVQGNYNVEYVTGTLEITKATATVTANDASKVAGNSDPAFTAVVTGLQNGDTESVITYTVSRETGETVGTYAITPAGDAVQGNYNVTYVPGTFTIESAVVSVTHDETVTYFADFKEAVEAAQANDTITVLADFTIDESKTETTDRIVITKPVTIDFGAYTMSVPGALEPTSNWAALYVDADTTIRATTGGIDCLDKENGECGVYAFNVRNNATLTIESGSYHGGGTVAQAQLGTINVTGGTFTATPFEAPYGMNFVFNCSDAAYTAGNASIAITGGTFVGFDPQCNAAEGANTRFVPANYVAIDDGSVSFTVQPGGTITFDLTGGSGTGDYSEQRIPSGGTVTEPAAPTKEACVFSGWLLDGEAYDFTTPVTGDITLTANWGHAVAMIGRVGYATLPEAIAAAQASGTTIRMVDDITVTAAVVFPADKDITLNLAGHSITGDLPKSNILTVNGGLTVTDSSDPSAGLIENTGSTNNNAKTINVGNSGTFTLESGTLRGAKRTIYTSGTGTIVVNGGTVTTTASGGFGAIYGGHVTVNGGTISAPNDNFAISPRTLMVTDGTISGGKYGVYLSSTYSDSFGTVTGGTITGGSSYAISLGSKSSLKITGGTLNSADGFVGINLGGTGCITADSGAAYVENSNACATVVDENDNILVEGYYGIIGVGQLSEAEGNTVKLLKDVEITSQVVINKSTTLDLNGHSITRTGTTTNSNFSAIQVTKGDVTITGNGTVTAVDDGNGPGVSAVTVNGSPVHLTIESGEFIVNGNNTAVYIQKGNTAANPNTVTITGGAFRTTDGDPGFLLNILDSQREKAQFIVQGGTFYGFDPQDNAAEGANTRFVPADYVAINDGEGNFTVQAGGTITFDLNGGTGAGDYSEQRIPSGQTVTEPSPVPVKANYQFKEWQQGGVAYDFDTAVTGDFELVAAYDEAVARIGDDYYATLSGAVAAAESGDTIILLSDSSESRVTISKSLTLDLNDYTFTGRVTIDNGTVTVENGTIAGRFDAYDNATVTLAADAAVTGQAVVWGDGTYGEAGCKTPTLNVYGTITNTGETAISTNGTDKSGAIINIYDGAVLTSTDDIAIYLPSGNLNIEGGSITGTTAVYAKSGSVTVTGGTLTATGAAAEYSFNGNGGNSTGDALVIESCGYPNGDPTVSVTGGTFVSANAQAIASYATEGNTAAEHFVSGGEFNTVLDVSIVEEGSQCTTTLTNENGYYYIVDEITVTFTVDGETYATVKIPTGEAIPAAEIPTNPTSATRLFAGWYANETAYDLSTATFSSDTTLTAAWTDAVAQIGSTPYASLSEAIAAAQAGDTVKLLQNASESRVTISKSLTLDLDGNIFTGRVTIDNGTVTVEDGEIVGRFDIYDNATVTLASTATVNGQAVIWGDGTYGEAGCKTPTLNVYGTITNTGDSAISTNGTDTSGAIINVYDGAIVTSTGSIGIYLPSGNLNIEGGAITGTTAVYAKSGSVTISGGTLTGNGAAADYSYNGNGANATGDALMIDTCGYPNGDPTVSVTGGTFVSTNGKAIASYATEGNTAAAGFVEDGEFNTPLAVAIVADGYQCTTTLTNENGYYYIVEDVTVTFDANGGSDVEAVKLPKGEAVDEPTTSRTGYTFDAWQLNGADYDFTAAVTEDIELTATWTPIPYTITWKNYDGSVIDETTVDYDATPTHDDATRADDADYHYTFNGWTPEIVAVTGDAEYTATYTTTDRSYGQPVWTWDGTESATASFTTNDGYAEFTLTETAEGAAITHETTTAETCETDGVETYTATVTFRGTEYTDQTTEIRAALGHDYTYYYIWNTDNTSVIARRVCENDHSHTNYERVATTSEVTKTATCEEEGEITYTATFTAEYFETQTKVVATPKTHTYEPVWVWLDSETAYVEVRCSNCNDLLTRIAADITETITKEATCTEAGEKTYTATAVYNGETLTDTWSETAVIPATGHTLTAHEATTATCEVAGNSAYWSCESCGKYFSDAEGTTEIEADSWIIPAIGHDWNEPTYSDYDEDAGTVTATRTCKNDPSHVEVETAQVDETAYTVPTCTEAGSRTLTAAFENEAFSWMRTVEIPANGHSLTAHEANEPTCTEIGNSAYWSCDVCGKYFSDANGATEIEDNSWIISSTGHSYGEPLWTWNGNDADGYTSAIATFTCTKCDHVETIADDELDYMVTVEATEAAPGSATYTAIVELDGETYTGTKTVDVPYVKLDYPNFTIVGVVQSFRPEEVENIVTVTDSLAGKFNITYDMACMVAVKTIEIVDGEEIEHYQMLHCTEFEGEENTYAYDLSELEYTFESDIEIIVAIKGDINGDGRLTSRDATMISRALLTEGNEQRLTLDGLSAFMADTTQDGRFTSRDKTRLSQALLTGENKKPFDWDLAS